MDSQVRRSQPQTENNFYSQEEEERIMLAVSTPSMLVGFVFGFILIINVMYSKSLHKPRHIFQALSVSSSLMSQVFGLYGLIFLTRSCGFADTPPRFVFLAFIFNRYLLLATDILPSIDRLVAILFPLKYQVYGSSHTAKMVCLLSIFLSLSVSIISKVVTELNAMLNYNVPGYLAGILPSHIGQHQLDHFRLVSTENFVWMVTLPFIFCLVTCLLGDSAALYVALRQIRKQKKRMAASDPPLLESTREERLDETIATPSSVSRQLTNKQSPTEASFEDKRLRKKKIHELQISVRCLSLSGWFFLSQLCTYTPGIVFYRCGDNVANISANHGYLRENLSLVSLPASEPIMKKNSGNLSPLFLSPHLDANSSGLDSVDLEGLQDCDNLLSRWPRIFIFLFYQIQFIKSLLFLAIDKALKDAVMKNMSSLCTGNI